MKTLTVRQVDDAAHEGLRVYAASKGKSMEEVMREVIVERFGPEKKQPDFTLLRELQKRVAASLPPDAPSAAEMVRQFRDEDNAAVDAKLKRVDKYLARLKAKKETGSVHARHVGRTRSSEKGGRRREG